MKVVESHSAHELNPKRDCKLSNRSKHLSVKLIMYISLIVVDILTNINDTIESKPTEFSFDTSMDLCISLQNAQT